MFHYPGLVRLAFTATTVIIIIIMCEATFSGFIIYFLLEACITGPNCHFKDLNEV